MAPGPAITTHWGNSQTRDQSNRLKTPAGLVRPANELTTRHIIMGGHMTNWTTHLITVRNGSLPIPSLLWHADSPKPIVMHSREPHPPPGIALPGCRNLGEMRNTLQLLPVLPPSRSRTHTLAHAHFGARSKPWKTCTRKGPGARGNGSKICRSRRSSNKSRAHSVCLRTKI